MKARRWFRSSVLGACLLLAPAWLGAEEPSIQVRLHPDPVGLEDAATLEIRFEGPGFRSPKLDPTFELENLEILFGPARAQSFQWIQGETSASVTLTWRLRPLRPGPARVFSIRVLDADDPVTLPEQKIEVVEGSVAPEPRSLPGRRGFPGLLGDPFEGLFEPREPRVSSRNVPKVKIVSEVEPASGWVGEQRVWRLVLLTQGDVSAFQPRSLPDFRGFWTREIQLPERVALTWVDLEGERYARQVMLSRALFPIRPGTLEVDPVPVELVLRVVESGFGGVFARPLPRKLETNRVEVQARPLPPPPPGFQGLVGELRLSSRLDRSEIHAGEAVTLRIRLESTGQAASLSAPSLELPAGLRAFPPKASLEESFPRGTLASRLDWDYVLLAESPGQYTLPAVEVPYFDPRAGRYVTSSTQPGLLLVLPAREEPPAPAGAGEPPPAVPPSAVVPPRSWGWTTVVALALGVAMAALLASLGLRRFRRPRGRMASGSAGFERIRAELEIAAGEPPRAAAERISRAWQALLWSELGLPLDQPLEVSARTLIGSGSPELGNALERVAAELRALLEAPSLADLEAQREELLESCRGALRALR